MSHPASPFQIIQSIQHRLNMVLEAARTVPFDNSSRLVFFSDLHRGNRGPTDAFRHNAQLFLHALSQYERKGFTYVEVGDGDELWKSWPFEEIRHAHRKVFDLLHHLNRDQRLHLILGNHDVKGKPRHQVEKDGITAREGLVLRHQESGRRLFVFHGHQVDLVCDRMSLIARSAVRITHRVRDRVKARFGQPDDRRPMDKLEQRILTWVRAWDQIVICGHTHRPAFPKLVGLPYFNTGSGVIPGSLTGLELQNGALVPIRWVQSGIGHFQRVQAGPHTALK